jgi:acyl-CoA synthetase (AMP-forming)/AMP-acid ligase II
MPPGSTGSARLPARPGYPAAGSAAELDRWRREGWYRPGTLLDDFDAGARQRPGAELVFAGRGRPGRLTLAGLRLASQRAAAGLRRRGVGLGDVVALQLPNWPEAVVALYATLELGAVALPIIHSYEAAELAFILGQSGARVFVVPGEWRGTDFAARAQELRQRTGVRDVVVVGEQVPPGAVAWADLEAPDPRAGPFARPAVTGADPCLLIYTSGTTAEPKGVVHTHNTIRAELTSEPYRTGPDAALLSCWPAGHIAGLLAHLRLSFGGRSLVFIDRWDADLAAELVEEHAITEAAGTPFFLDGLLRAAHRGGRDLSSLGEFRVSAASVAPQLVKRATDAGIVTFRAYGSSEHPTISVGHADAPLAKRLATDGRIIPGIEIRLVDTDGQEVPEGTPGEILSRGPDLFVGYLDPSLTERAFQDGWFATGDVGYLDADGYLTISDRLKDIVIRGGENISSKEVEDVLGRHPAVAECAVVGAADPVYGERVCAFVIVSNGSSLDLAEVRRHFAAERVARLKTPERLEIVTELPRTAAGKIKKFELRVVARHHVPERD